MNSARIIADYRAACCAARIDPAVGPVTTFQCVNAIAEARRRRLWRLVVAWWLYEDWRGWLEEGSARSETEHLAIIRLWLGALLAAYAADHPPLPRSAHHTKPLREVLADRGATVHWDKDEAGRLTPEVVGVAEPT